MVNRFYALWGWYKSSHVKTCKDACSVALYQYFFDTEKCMLGISNCNKYLCENSNYYKFCEHENKPL